MKTYEEWAEKVHSLAPSSLQERRVAWDETSGALGVSLLGKGQLQVMIAGPRLQFRNPAVTNRVTYETWSSTALGTVTTNILTLPSGTEFIPAAAWICAELQREGVDEYPQKAVDRTESIIALILDGLASSANNYTGLLGEMHLLAALVEMAPPEHREAVIKGWHGHAPSLRDIALGTSGIEVKTTSTSEPAHHFQGTYQVERKPDESSLTIVSLGIERDSQAEDSRSLDDELARIQAHLAETLEAGQVATLMDGLRVHVDDYGVASSTNLMADALQHKILRKMRFAVQWVRGYDASSPSLSLPTAQKFSEVSNCLVLDSVRFALHLPTDPSTPGLSAGMQNVARACLVRAGLLEGDYTPRHREDDPPPSP